MSRLALNTNQGYFTTTLPAPPSNASFTVFGTIKLVSFKANDVFLSSGVTSTNNYCNFSETYTRAIKWQWDATTDTVLTLPDESLVIGKWVIFGVSVRAHNDYTLFSADEDGNTYSVDGTATLTDWVAGQDIDIVTLFQKYLSATPPADWALGLQDALMGPGGVYSRGISAAEITALQNFTNPKDIPDLIHEWLEDYNDGTDLNDEIGTADLTTVITVGETVYPLYNSDVPPFSLPSPGVPILTELTAIPDYDSIGGTVTTTVYNGIMYAAFFTAAGDRTHAVIKAGTGALASGNVVVTGSSVVLPDLAIPQDTPGYLWVSQEDITTAESSPIYVQTSTLANHVNLAALTYIDPLSGGLWANKTDVQYLVMDVGVGGTASDITIRHTGVDAVVDANGDTVIPVGLAFSNGDEVLVLGIKPAVSTILDIDTEFFIATGTVIGAV